MALITSMGYQSKQFAVLYASQGRYMQAELYYGCSLKIMEKSLGLHHPDVPIGLDNLAGLYRTTNRISKAEELELLSAASIQVISSK
ncbi:MAG: tetratricopeptide repeat protein [Nitrosospira multiformis]|nr:tetratricopeptide repeat protein [Nitrosospira multiformis]